MKFPVFSLLAGNSAPETGSLVTTPSGRESTANPIFLEKDARTAPIVRDRGARFGAWRRPPLRGTSSTGALGRRTHPRLVDEALGRHIDRTSFAASRGVDVQRGLSPCRFSR
jgi:hypothetical protein